MIQHKYLFEQKSDSEQYVATMNCCAQDHRQVFSFGMRCNQGHKMLIFTLTVDQSARNLIVNFSTHAKQMVYLWRTVMDDKIGYL